MATHMQHPPLAYVDVFVDDFISLAQGNASKWRTLLWQLLHSIDQVFWSQDNEDSPHHKEPISIKKLLSGNAAWHTSKTILGWVVNTMDMTITLPPHWQE